MDKLRIKKVNEGARSIKWLNTRNVSFLNKYKLYRNKIVSINKLYRTLYYNKILADSTNTKKMWDNINFIIHYFFSLVIIWQIQSLNSIGILSISLFYNSESIDTWGLKGHINC